MAAPVITSVTPAVGHSGGQTHVEIVGTGFNLPPDSVNVRFDGKAATEIKVVSAILIRCLTPNGVPGTAVDVVVENVTGAVLEPTTLASAWTWQRPDLSTSSTLSSWSEIALTHRELVKLLRQQVLENVHADMHPDYVSAISGAAEETARASLPHLKILGPTVVENTFYTVRGRIDQANAAGGLGEYDIHDQPITVDLQYRYLGVGSTPPEAMALLHAVMLFFRLNPFLVVPRDGVDVADTISFEMDRVREDTADFRGQATREAIYQFAGAFVVRGVPTLTGRLVDKGVQNQDEPDGNTVDLSVILL